VTCRDREAASSDFFSMVMLDIGRKIIGAKEGRAGREDVGT
jgi:hypothetical protein